jgi:hypothetical protein
MGVFRILKEKLYGVNHLHKWKSLKYTKLKYTVITRMLDSIHYLWYRLLVIHDILRAGSAGNKTSVIGLNIVKVARGKFSFTTQSTLITTKYLLTLNKPQAGNFPITFLLTLSSK